jgi:hypothetical protein
MAEMIASNEYGFGVMDDARMAVGIKVQAEHCRRNDAPVTAHIVKAQIALMQGDTKVGKRIANWPGLPLEDALPLRLAGGLHHLHLTGTDDRLGQIYRGDVTDQTEIDALIAAITYDHDARLLPWLDGPPQTNEAGRSANFMAALLWLSSKIGTQFELNELGASAGINSMMDRYHYDLGGVNIGPAASPMRIRPDWRGPPPPNSPVTITRISSCDQAPIDLSDPTSALRVKSYVWPENIDRLARMDAAIALAAVQPPNVAKADALDWVLERLSSRQEQNVVRIFNHSIVWQYIPEDRRQKIRDAIETAGQSATPERPLAWIMLETNRETFKHELSVKYWPGPDTSHLLAEAHAHGAWIDWHGD